MATITRHTGSPDAKRRDVGDEVPLRRRLSLQRILVHAARFDNRGQITLISTLRPTAARNIAAAFPFEIAIDMLP